MKKQTGKNALIFVAITVAIDAIGLGIIMPVLPNLIQELTGLGLDEAAIHGGWLTFTYALMQFIFMPIIGGLSDAYGRRRIMLFSLFFLGLDYLLMGWAPTITLLYLGRLISGATGATYSTANAYIADISPPDKRAQSFGVIGAAFGIGFVMGPVIGGLLGDMNPRTPFYAAAIAALVNTIYGFFFFPETLKPENRRAFSWHRANPLGTFKSILALPQLKGFLVVMFLFSFAHFSYPAVFSFFTQHTFEWSPSDVGIALGFFGVCSAFVQGYLIRIAIPKLGMIQCAIIGSLMNAIAFIGLGFATSGMIGYFWLIPAALGGLATPAIQHLMSIRVADDAQGELQGAIGSLSGLAMLGSPLIMTHLFHSFAAKNAPINFPGAPFLLAGILVAIGLLVFIWSVRTVPIVANEKSHAE
ncbi:MAG: tetracycline resistance MFS efflux pump [Robiginitomaculum sp.]|nr:MAG: tetracycline resistance MFS efflux pump [Robiginitomaculum sp.]